MLLETEVEGVSIVSGTLELQVLLPYDCTEVTDFPEQRLLDTDPYYFTCHLILKIIQEELCNDFKVQTDAEDEKDADRDLQVELLYPGRRPDVCGVVGC